MEDLEGLHAADWKENTTASEVKGGRGKADEAQGEAQGEAQDEQAQPTPGVAPGEAFSSLLTSYKRFSLKPLKNQTLCFSFGKPF